MTNEELRIAIAKAKGWKPTPFANFWYQMISPDTGKVCNIPDYPNDIAAAMELVEEMENAGNWVRIETPFVDGESYFCGCTPKGTTGWNGKPDIQEPDETLARAICDCWFAWSEQE